ncbi:hypothetical protein UN63_14645 [Oceanisphaera arctica]|uniref:O-antigen polymerase n=1 Tax=Oceanisphaera arctica TaxID=641510 RepID=A0A2P5TIW7_9GAMM|nr:hypothetical protein UN63_14645 [Oceanisphaera arctica]
MSVFLFFVLLLISLKKLLSINNNIILFLPPFFLVLMLSIISGSSDFISAVVFFIYLSAFVFFDRVRLKFIINKSCFIYFYGAVFMALGVIVQRFLYERIGYEFGKINIYGGGRVGFGFLWLDYSFLSLYLVSALPLVLNIYKNHYMKIIASSILLLGSVVTTARTGLAALIIATLFVGGLEITKYLAKGKAKKSTLRTLLILFLSSLVVVYFYVEFSNRTVSFDSSGRFHGYYLGFQSFLDSPFLGVMFNRDYFLENYGTIPHNLFVYILSQGGILFFTLFFIWFFYVFYVAAFKVEVFRYPIIITIFGFMFIPSFFSAYFFALLISFCMAEKKAISYSIGK